MLGRNGMGKTTLIRSIMGSHAAADSCRDRSPGAARASDRLAAARYRRAQNRDRATGAAVVPLADSDRASDDAQKSAREDRMDGGAPIRPFSAARRAASPSRRAIVRRRTRYAGGRPRADDRSRIDPHGRALRGACARDGAASGRHRDSTSRRRHFRSYWSSKISTARWWWRIASISSKWERWFTNYRPGHRTRPGFAHPLSRRKVGFVKR